jgi:hypothetical protein
LVAPLSLDNDDIKEKEGEDILFQEELLTIPRPKELTLKGLPIDSNEYSPMIVLVPHIRV